MLFDTNKNKGRAGMAMGIAYYGVNGYTVNIPLNDTQWYDFVIEKDGKFETVQCKAINNKENAVDLRSTGGTNGGIYDNVMNHPLDYLFCIDGQSNLYSIKVQDMRDFGCSHSIRLRTQPNSNNKGFETYKYLVKI